MDALSFFVTEGDRKAYYENAEYAMKQNREKIARLRQENNDLYKQKAQKLAVSRISLSAVALSCSIWLVRHT